MFKCSKCGASNEMGNLFCRTCGERLDMQAVEDEIKRSQQGFSKARIKKAAGIGRKLMSLLLLLLFVAILVGLFIPAKLRVNEADLSAADRDNALKKLTVLSTQAQQLRGVEIKYKFTSAELTLAANRLLGLDKPSADSEGGVLAPEHLSIELLGSGYVRLVLRSQAFKNVKVYSVLVGRFEMRNDKVLFTPRSAYVGRVRLPGPAQKIVLDRYKALLEGEPLIPRLQQNIDDIEVRQNQVMIAIQAS